MNSRQYDIENRNIASLTRCFSFSNLRSRAFFLIAFGPKHFKKLKMSEKERKEVEDYVEQLTQQESMKRKIAAVVFVFAMCAVGALWPLWSKQIVPRWRIRVVDKNGEPVRSEPLIQYWKHYSYEIFMIMPHEEPAVTDMEGFVEFPERSAKVSTAMLVIGEIWNHLPLLSGQFGYGPHSFVICQESKCSTHTYIGGDLPELTTITAE